MGLAPVISGSPASASLTITVPAAGNHTLVATYGGDTNFSGSTSPAVTIFVSKSVPTVTVTPATTTPAAGSSLQISATVAPPTSGAAAPTGTITFTLDGNAVGNASLNAGSPSTATITIVTPGVGSHTLQASYNGDADYVAAVSPAVLITVGKSSTTLSLTPSTTTPTPGSSLLLTSTLTTTIVGASVPTGTVNFLLDGVSVASSALIGGAQATVTITAPSIGSHLLQASYSGDTVYNSSLSPLVTITVSKYATNITVTPATTTPALGATLPVNATITTAATGSTLPTGVVSFTLDGITTAIQAVVSGNPATASVTLPALSPGAHTLSATYSGDAYYAASTATAVTVTVAKSPTTTTITPATTSVKGGSPLQVNATVVPTTVGPSLPTGTVAFMLDGVTAGTAALVAGSPANANITLSALTPGTHLLQGVYSGDTYYATSTSPAITITVSKSATVTTLVPSSIAPTAGGSMQVTVSITSPDPGGTQPSGTVNITMDGTSVAGGTVVPGAPSTAVVTIPLVSAGSHILQAIYSGDTYYTGSTSAPVDIVAARGATTTTVTATPPALAAGITETLTATIAPVNAVAGTVYTITGTVSFYDGGTTLLGKVAVVDNAATLTGIALKDNVNHTITAIYSGDTNWLPSASSVLPLAATTLPDYVVLTANVSTATPGQAVILTATVTPDAIPSATGEPNPTGNVIFYLGTTILGESALVAVPLTDTSTATLTLANMPGGQDTVYAYYLGDLYYDAADSNLLTLDIQDFTITPDPSNPATNLTIIKGSAGTATYDIKGLGGFNGQIQVVCAVPAQDDMSCIASPQQVTPDAAVTFTVQTYTTGTTPPTTSFNRQRPPPMPRALGGTALALLGFFLLPFGRRARIFAGKGARRFWILLLLLAALGGAGIGCNSVSLGGITGSSGGTPLGVATFKITASDYVDNTVFSRSVYLTVNVIANPNASE